MNAQPKERNTPRHRQQSVRRAVKRALSSNIGFEKPMMRKHLNLLKKFFLLLKETAITWHRDNVIQLAGALSFFTVISIMPVLILTIAVGGSFLGQEQAKEELIKQTTILFSSEVGKAFKGFLESSKEAGAGIASLLSLLLLYVVSSRIFFQLQDAMNWIWKVPQEEEETIKSHLLRRFISFLILIGMGLFLIFFFTLNFIFQYFQTALHTFFPDTNFSPPSMILPLLIYMGLCAVTYRYVPQTKVQWKDVWMGSLLTTFLFYLGRAILIVYFKYSNVISFYGAAGSVIILLIWIYFSSQIFLFGAEFSYVYAKRYGSLAIEDQKRNTFLAKIGNFLMSLGKKLSPHKTR